MVGQNAHIINLHCVNYLVGAYTGATTMGPVPQVPQLLSWGTNKLLVPQLLAVVSCKMCRVVDFVTYAVMKVVHRLQPCI